MLNARHLRIIVGAFLFGALNIIATGTFAGVLAEKVGPKLRVMLSAPEAVEIGKKSAGVLTEGEHARIEVLIQGDIDAHLLRAHGAEPHTVMDGLATASAPLAAVESLARSPRISSVRMARELKTLLDDNIPETHVDEIWGAQPPNYPQSGFTGNGVIVGIIDTGIDFTHEDFKKPNGSTRILNIWDHGTASSPPPAGYAYGSEWSQSQINSGACTQEDDDGHGTHIAGAAVGNGRGTGNGQPQYTYVGMAPEADIIVVKLSWLIDSRVIDAVSYIFDRADALGKDAVVCLAVGKQYGGHDGTDPLDVAMDNLSGSGKIVVAAAGNDGEAEIHGELSPGRNQTETLSFTVPPHSTLSDEFVDLEGWYDQGSTYSFTIRTPSGQTLGPYSEGDVSYTNTSDGGVTVTVSSATSGPKDFWLNLSKSSTSAVADGEWRVDVKAVGTPAAGVDFWVAGYKFTGSTPVAIVQGQNFTKCITSPASANEVVAATAYTVNRSWVNQNGQTMNLTTAIQDDIADFSSLGPRRDGMVKPDIAASGYGVVSAMSSDAVVFFSFIAQDGVHYMATGTSLSAAVTTGGIALLLEENPGLSPNAVKSEMQQRAKVDGFTGSTPNPVWGLGKLSMVVGSTTAVGEDPGPGPVQKQVLLGAPYPNPYLLSGLARVPIELGQDSHVRVSVFDIRGREVRVLHEGILNQGTHTLSWDGRDGATRPVPSGRYYMRASGGGSRASTPIMVLK